MRSIKAFAAALGWLLAGPAAAAITVTAIGSGSVTSGTAVAITTTAACASGANLVVYVTNSNNIASTGLTDANSDTYTGTPSANLSASGLIQIWYSSTLTSSLASGASLSAAFASSIGTKWLSAVCVTGLTASPYDTVVATPYAGSTANPTVTTPALATNLEIVFGELGSASTTVTYTEPSTFTALPGTTVTRQYVWGYDMVSSSAAVTFNPTGSASASLVLSAVAFKGTGGSSGGAAVGTRVALTGAGH